MNKPWVWTLLFLLVLVAFLLLGKKFGGNVVEIPALFTLVCGSLLAVTGTVLLLARVCGGVRQPIELISPSLLILAAGALGSYGVATIAFSIVLTALLLVGVLRKRSADGGK